jgi:hypothetical protein
VHTQSTNNIIDNINDNITDTTSAQNTWHVPSNHMLSHDVVQWVMHLQVQHHPHKSLMTGTTAKCTTSDSRVPGHSWLHGDLTQSA